MSEPLSKVARRDLRRLVGPEIEAAFLAQQDDQKKIASVIDGMNQLAFPAISKKFEALEAALLPKSLTFTQRLRWLATGAVPQR